MMIARGRRRLELPAQKRHDALEAVRGADLEDALPELRGGADGLEADRHCVIITPCVSKGREGKEGNMEPLAGMPSTSLSLAFARAVVASWGREVRMREAERGRGRAAARAASGSSSGMGGDWEGLGEEEEDMVVGLWRVGWCGAKVVCWVRNKIDGRESKYSVITQIYYS